MPYIALKSVTFDRAYLIGEQIPDRVVDPGRAAALEGMGLIAPVTAQDGAGAAESAKGTNTLTDAENGAETAQDGAESEKSAKGKK